MIWFIHITWWPLIPLMFFGSIIFSSQFTANTQTYGHTTDSVITDNCTSYLTITSDLSRPLILKLPFQQFSDITEAPLLPYQTLTIYQFLHFLLSQNSTVHQYYLPTYTLTFFATVYSLQKLQPIATYKRMMQDH